MKKLLLFLVMMLLPKVAIAYDFTINGIAYNITSVANKTVEVTYFGDGGIGFYPNEKDKSNYSHYQGIITIPNEVEFEGRNYTVTAIGNRAFIYTNLMDEILLPNSITRIGDGAFYFSNIKSITFPNQITELGEGCFMYCSNLKDIIIPQTINKLPDTAFGYSGLEKVTIPNTIKVLGYCCFENCENLREVNFNGSLFMETFNKNGSLTFYKCKNIEKIVSVSENPYEFNNNTFESLVYLHAKLIVPKSTAEKYKNTSGWNNFVNIEEDPYLITKYKLIYYVDGVEYKSYEIEPSSHINPEPDPTKEGYTFSGWSEIPEAMPSHDVTVTGTFAINKYNLTYMVDGTVYKTVTYDYGATITPELVPTKEGYTFSGWPEIPSTMPAKDVTVTGSFTINKYKLIYMVDGSEYKLYEIEYGATITPEAEPTKEGYTFSGWSNIPATMPANDVTVTGSFTINRYNLTYSVDGKEYKSYELDYGTNITPEPTPTKEGYTFSGWSEIPETMPAHDVTVCGSFTINKYKLTYMVDDAEYKTYDLEYGAKITPEHEPTKEGYTFSGWSEIPETMPAHDVTVTGTFYVNKYKLTYIVDSEEYKSYELDYGATITPESAPTKEGCIFGGWNEIPETMPAHDVTITGTFIKGSYKLTYIVDGEVYKTISYDYGDVVTPEPAPLKEGYTFSGWSDIPEKMPAHDVTVTGTFTINKYKLTYMVDGKAYKSYETEYGASITPEAAPTKEGYTFSGWSEIPKTMPAHDVAVTSTFTINKYKLTYIVDDEEYKSYVLDYGTTITPETKPTKEGSTFSGWSEIPETMPAHDITITGTFFINSYKLTYMIDDKVYKETMYEYDATIIPEPQPEGDYATFEWIDLPQKMPAHDVVVYASYTSGIMELLMTSRQEIRIYSPNGKRLTTLQKGVNIIRMNDGKTKKIVVK